MQKEFKLMKGNEAVAEAAIRAGCDGYFGYPITPQSEIMEYLMLEQPEKRTGMVVLQAESEVAAINMVYGGAGCGKRVMTSSSSPGISLKQEGISYMAGAELPCLLVNIVRGGPGLGTIQPSQQDYFQSVKGGGHGDYRVIVLAPASVQEMADFAVLGFDLAFKYRIPTLILSDGIIGQMMEKVVLPEQRPRFTEEEIRKNTPWATVGKTPDRERNVISSLNLIACNQEAHVNDLKKKYDTIEENEVRYETYQCDDAEHVIIAYGSSARISRKAVDLLRAEGRKVGLLRPITLFPFPKKQISDLVAKKVKGFLTVEMSLGQMVEDVKLVVNGQTKVEHYGRVGGSIPTPEEVADAVKSIM
ncbi:MAG: 3-methyl-2-oxobutanoate dehydrogenase subunit VorB [Bacteroidales bacterium]|nr:3-methyl-2-oxobutanoate dehydrogenase subunit VorB [Bacteroidales bacterium]